MAGKTEFTKTFGERELTITRVFDAPREVVWKAWTDPKQMAKWWGPFGFTNPVCKLDVRPGGAWHIVMRGPDGAEYPCGGVYREVVEPERLVFTNNAIGKEGEQLLEGFTRVTFEDQGGKTKLTLYTRAVAVVDFAAGYLKGMEAGWTQSIDRLGGLVSPGNTADREIVVTRVFEAPRELVWEAWTEAKHLVQWWGPRGFTTTVEVMDVRPGGVWKHVMHGPDGADYPNESVFTEVVKPERISFCHGGRKEGGPSVLFESTWSFDALEKGKTRVSIRMVFSSAAERDRVAKEFGAVEGGKQTLERLGEHLPAMAEAPR
jgi:uncharacterized protein YndB with AHSA1/START domain